MSTYIVYNILYLNISSIYIYSLQPGHLEDEHNYRKVKRSKSKKKGRKRVNPKYRGLLPVKIITGPWQKSQG